MPHPDTLALLREALDLLNDRPNFGLRRDPHQTSYKLASRIEAHRAELTVQATHPAIDIARRLWSDDHHVQVDHGEQEISEGQDGIWVRAWLLVDADDLPDDEPDPPAAASGGGGEAIKRAVTAKANRPMISVQGIELEPSLELEVGDLIEEHEQTAALRRKSRSNLISIEDGRVFSRTLTLEIGRYLVLNTIHVSWATAEQLDTWSTWPPGNCPVAVADTRYGWFVALRRNDVGDPALPHDLQAAFDFALRHGADHLLFDRDAGPIQQLASYDW